MAGRPPAMAALLMMLVMPGACHAPPAPLSPAQAAARHPADARLAALYDGSCRACHTMRDSGAPLSGDHTQWDARWAKGPDVLLQDVIAGYNAMPAGGQCGTCTAADYAALIRFLADQPGEHQAMSRAAAGMTARRGGKV